jgi:dipeptidyl aminopeptidase/acylaminoacyl peptidase
VGRLVVLALVVTASASAAQPGSNGRILLLEDGDLFTVTAEGGDRRQLTFDGRNSSGTFSPNGERISFLKSDGSSPRDLYVVNADGEGGARLIATHPETTNAGGIHGITWSPDSARIAYFLTSPRPAIRIVDARDGTPDPLPQSDDPRGPRPFGALEWSPDGSELVYDDGGDIWVQPLDGRPARQLVGVEGQDSRPTWSPDGSRIAFIHAGSEASGGVYVVRRDGTELRHVAATGIAFVGAVRWKPDGTAVVFDGTRQDGYGPRGIPLSTSSILVAGAEGSLLRHLRDHVARPVPSPDNAQMLVDAYQAVPGGGETTKRGVYTMNADGTCLTLVTGGTGLDWQRVPAGGPNVPRECVDLVVSASAPAVTGLRGVPYSISVRNEGTLTASAVQLRLAVDVGVRFVIGRVSAGACAASVATVTCRVPRLEPGDAVEAEILARPEAPAPLVASVSVASGARDSDPASDEASVRTRVYGCWISGTDFDDELQGTAAGEHICGRAGNDLIRAEGGNDVVDGGWGLDTLLGGPGRDRLVGGRGNDTIHSRDGQRDTIECGWGEDRAFVDRLDRVLRGCEAVHRR